MMLSTEFWAMLVYVLIGVRYGFKFFVYHASYPSTKFDMVDYFIAAMFVMMLWPFFIVTRIVRDEW